MYEIVPTNEDRRRRRSFVRSVGEYSDAPYVRGWSGRTQQATYAPRRRPVGFATSAPIHSRFNAPRPSPSQTGSLIVAAGRPMLHRNCGIKIKPHCRHAAGRRSLRQRRGAYGHPDGFLIHTTRRILRHFLS